MLEQLDIAIAFIVVMLLLSLLVTALVQAISALLDLRGRNLVRALSSLLAQVCPELKQDSNDATAATGTYGSFSIIKDRWDHPFSRKISYATRIADAVAAHPTLAHTFTRAKAIRKDELLNLLKALYADTSLQAEQNATSVALGMVMAAQSAGGAQNSDTVQAIVTALRNNFSECKDDLARVVDETVGKISRLEVGVEKWFDTVMDRSSDIFTRWTRTVTVIISVLLVGALQIDSGLILHQISTNSGIKAGLTRISDAALAQADEVLTTGDRVTTSLKAVAQKHQGSLAAALDAAPRLTTCADGEKWLEDYGTKTKTNVDEVQKEFDDECRQQTITALGSSEAQIGKLQRELADSELEIVPERIDGQSVFGETNDSLISRIESWARAYRSGRHLLGTMAMMILLSLGAPFWYNTLSQVANLRPGISTKVAQEASSNK